MYIIFFLEKIGGKRRDFTHFMRGTLQINSENEFEQIRSNFGEIKIFFKNKFRVA